MSNLACGMPHARLFAIKFRGSVFPCRFLFDLMLVALMIFETWAMPIYYAASGGGSGLASGTSVLRIFRIMRVLRTARMARLVRLMPELMSLG